MTLSDQPGSVSGLTPSRFCRSFIVPECHCLRPLAVRVLPCDFPGETEGRATVGVGVGQLPVWATSGWPTALSSAKSLLRCRSGRKYLFPITLGGPSLHCAALRLGGFAQLLCRNAPYAFLKSAAPKPCHPEGRDIELDCRNQLFPCDDELFCRTPKSLYIQQPNLCRSLILFGLDSMASGKNFVNRTPPFNLFIPFPPALYSVPAGITFACNTPCLVLTLQGRTAAQRLLPY